MYLLYSLLYTIGFIAFLPWMIYEALRHGKYAAGFGERMGRLPQFETHRRPVIWLHCVSVGETQAARPVARALLERFPTHALVVSTITLTGQQIAREVFRDEAAAVFYFPFDWAWSVRRALRRVNPSTVLIMETELWPRFLRECRRRLVGVALINGRLSAKSVRNYKLIRPFIARVVNDLDLALMQTEEDAARIRSLGLAPELVIVSGNMKFDAGATSNESLLTAELRERFQFDDRRPLIIAASTHAPEERIILEALKQLRSNAQGITARLLFAPRHPERFAEVASLFDASGFKWARCSSEPAASDADCDLILLDSIGELRAVYPLAEIVFVGGSIARTGGHNVLEPAAVGACIVTGAHTQNFAAITRAFLEADALVQLPPISETEAPSVVANTFQELLADNKRRSSIGARALAVLEQNRGATERTINYLATLFEHSPDVQGHVLEAKQKLTHGT